MALRVIEKGILCPSSDIAKLAKDQSGSGLSALVPTPDEQRIWRQFHLMYEKHLLSKDAVDKLTLGFLGHFSTCLDEICSSEKWVEVKVHDMLCDSMFKASTTTLVGSKLLGNNPEFVHDFWQWDADFMHLLYGVPRLFLRKGWAARKRCLAAVKSFLEEAEKSSGVENAKADGFSPLVQARELQMRNVGMSFDGRASFELGLIWSYEFSQPPRHRSLLS